MSPLRRLTLALLLAMAGLLPAAAAQPLLLASSYWVDAGGKATLVDARRAGFQPYQGTLGKGYRAGAVWLRLRVAAAPAGAPLVLLIQPSFLRQVDLYDPAQAAPQHSGRATRLESTAYQGINLGFELPAQPQPRDVFLRIETPTSLIADCQLLTEEQALQQDRQLAAVLTLYTGFLLVSVAWGLIYWALYRDGLYGFFALRQLYSIGYTAVVVGLYRYLLADSLGVGLGDRLYNVLIVTLIVPVVAFDTRLLREFGASRRLRMLTNGMMMLCVVSLGFLLLGKTRQALSFSSMLGISTSLVLLSLAFSVRRQQGKPLGRLVIWVLRVGFSLMIVMAVLPMLAFQNVVHLGGGGVNLFIAQAGISTLQLMLLQLIHARQKEHAFQESLLEHRLTESRLEQESRRRAEKESFLAMITHELRNPLSVIRLLSGSGANSRAVQGAADDMARVIDRVLQSEKHDPGSLAVHKADTPLGLLLHELLQRQPQRQRIRLDADAAPALHTDRELLGAVLGNLLDNAIKYSPGHSTVELQVAPLEHEGRAGVGFRVSNAAGEAGLPDSTQLFNKYYRSPGAHRQIGSGLGLYLVAQWVRALGGSIAYQAVPAADGGELARFTVWMPQ